MLEQIIVFKTVVKINFLLFSNYYSTIGSNFNLLAILQTGSQNHKTLNDTVSLLVPNFERPNFILPITFGLIFFER